MNIEEYKKLENGTYKAICLFNSVCTITVNRFSNPLNSGDIIDSTCSINDCGYDCKATMPGGSNIYFDIIR